jgi:hypothetical protein
MHSLLFFKISKEEHGDVLLSLRLTVSAVRHGARAFSKREEINVRRIVNKKFCFVACTGISSARSSAYGIDDCWVKIKGFWAKGHSQVGSVLIECTASPADQSLFLK